jgi:hypothetical protein
MLTVRNCQRQESSDSRDCVRNALISDAGGTIVPMKAFTFANARAR